MLARAKRFNIGGIRKDLTKKNQPMNEDANNVNLEGNGICEIRRLLTSYPGSSLKQKVKLLPTGFAQTL
jgi:hypothetical protein